jgi:hypothetical protein
MSERRVTISGTHIRTILAASSRFDVHQGTHLDRGGVVKFSMNGALKDVSRSSEFLIGVSIQMQKPASSKAYHRSP